MHQLALIAWGIGLLLLVGSNVAYYRRTNDPKKTRFWLGRDLLTRGEYAANRLGLALVVVGFALLAVLR